MLLFNARRVKVIEQKIIEDWYDIMRLDIIDWERLNGSWPHPAEAVRSIVSWFAGHARYMIVECDLREAPKRDDWPGWEHTGGNHEYLGQLFWNTFSRVKLGQLIFSDEPDFSGTMHFPGASREIHFFGDINKVSAQTFALAQKKMGVHDLWISVVGPQRLVIIESLVDIQKSWESLLGIEEEI